jgi:WD40 repeat protein
MGPWQQREAMLALDRQAREPDFSVIPVMLPGAAPALGFLSLNTWIDVRGELDEAAALTALAGAVEGEAPGPELQDQVRRTRDAVCPYRGLNAFREEDAEFFFGREDFVDSLESTLRAHTFVAVVGPSGSGKSSAVRAGLVPRLRRSIHGVVWEVVTFLPSDRPLRAAAAALLPLLEPDMSETDRLSEIGKLAGLLEGNTVTLGDVARRVLEKQSGTNRLLIIVDQWEELYTLCHNLNERRTFVGQVIHASGQVEGISVVLTLRGDFFGHALVYRPLADALQQAVVNLGPMTNEELKQCITRPADKIGLTFEPGLVARILEDVQQEPGSLPLLEFVLTLLWEARSGGRLLHETYEKMGGLRGAIASKADEIFDLLSPKDREIARRIFLRLIRPGDGTEDTSRRTLSSELGADEDKKVVRQLTGARLLVAGFEDALHQETIEIAHEALIRNWDRLKTWLNEDREFLLWRQRLRAAIAEWKRVGSDAGALLRGIPLSEAIGWLSRRANDLTADEAEYIRTSREHQERERFVQERLRRRVVLTLTMGLALSLVLAAGVGLLWRRTEHEREAALARQLAAQAQILLEQRPQALEQSILLAAESLRRQPSGEAAGTLSDALARARRRAFSFATANVSPGEASISPDGRYFAGVGKEGDESAVIVWQTADGTSVDLLRPGVLKSERVSNLLWDDTGKMLAFAHGDQVEVREPEHPERAIGLPPHGRISVVALSSQGNIAATAADDERVRIWDLAAPQHPLAIIQHSPTYPEVTAIRFSVDGHYLITAGRDGVARIWDWRVSTTSAIHSVEDHRSLNLVAVSMDGQYLATGSWGGVTRLWEFRTGKELASIAHDDVINMVMFSPDSRYLITCSDDNTVRILEVPTRRMHVTVRHGDRVSAFSIDPDGRYLATASDDSTARLWDISTGKELARLVHTEPVISVAFAPGGTLVSVTADNSVSQWDIGHDATPSHEFGLTAEANPIAFSTDSAYVAVASKNPTVAFEKTRDNIVQVTSFSGKETVQRLRHESSVSWLAFTSGGKVLVALSDRGQVRAWEVPAGLEVKRIDGVKSISPDGRYAIISGQDKIDRLVDISTQNEVAQLVHDGDIDARDIVFSSNGQYLAARVGESASARPILLLETRGGKWVAKLEGPPTGAIKAVSPLGHYLIAAGVAGNTESANLQVLFANGDVREMAVPATKVKVTISNDDRYAAFTIDDGKVVVFTTWEWSAAAKFSPGGEVKDIAFSADSAYMATAGADGVARIWSITSGSEVWRKAFSGAVNRVTFSPDGQYFGATSADKTAWVGKWRTQDLLADACAVLARNLTEAEWREYLGDQRYRETCPGLSGTHAATKYTVSHALHSFIHAYRVAVENEEERDIERAIYNLLKHVESSAKQGDFQGARNQAQEALELMMRLEGPLRPLDDLDPIADADASAISYSLDKGIQLAKAGEINAAFEEYDRFARANPTAQIGAIWNAVCWEGALHDQAKDVLGACDRAVAGASASERPRIRDSRGVARCLVGDLAGAAEDFKAFVEWARSNEKLVRPELVRRRETWLVQITAGVNPIDAETLSALRSE